MSLGILCAVTLTRQTCLARRGSSLIQRSAKLLNDISRKTGWDVIEAPEYEHLSAEFRRLAISLEQAAERKNLDGATLAYLRLTSNCIECHKFTRGFRLAGAR